MAVDPMPVREVSDESRIPKDATDDIAVSLAGLVGFLDARDAQVRVRGQGAASVPHPVAYPQFGRTSHATLSRMVSGAFTFA